MKGAARDCHSPAPRRDRQPLLGRSMRHRPGRRPEREEPRKAAVSRTMDALHGRGGLPTRVLRDRGDLGPLVAGHPHQPELGPGRPVDRHRLAIGVEQNGVGVAPALDDVAAPDRDGRLAVRPVVAPVAAMDVVEIGEVLKLLEKGLGCTLADQANRRGPV